MTIRLSTLLLAALAAGTLASPSRAAEDSRVATRFYEPSRVVSVHGRAGIQSTIAFGTDERIENVAVGDSSAWQVTPNKRADLLFVKPISAHARTNMTVVTDQHTYLFDLVSSPGAPPVYMLRFTYPEPPPAKLQPEVKMVEAVQPAPVPIAAAAAASLANLNFSWKGKGDSRLLPARSFDDGRMTYLAWPEGAAMPAILVRDARGAEGPVNYTVQSGYIVVDGVPAELVLRSGRQEARLMPTPRPRTLEARAETPVALAAPRTAAAAPSTEKAKP